MKLDKRPLRIVDIPVPNKLYRKEYLCWSDMFKRCYNENWIEKHPTYVETEVCDEWLKFSNFLKWHQENYVEGWHLDKDLLGDGKIYSPETCCFIPAYINKFLTKRGSGVSKRGGVFIARISTGDDKTRIDKRFKTETEARNFYTKKKLERALTLADEYGLDDTLREAIVKFVYTNF